MRLFPVAVLVLVTVAMTVPVVMSMAMSMAVAVVIAAQQPDARKIDQQSVHGDGDRLTKVDGHGPFLKILRRKTNLEAALAVLRGITIAPLPGT